MQLERSILKIIRGETRAPIAKACLAALSTLYRAGVAARNFAYDKGFFSSFALDALVISVGNLAVGGTGKTPLVHTLATLLQDKTCLAILTRGYRSSLEKSGKTAQISAGSGPLLPVEECGDEPYLLAKKTRAAIWGGANRLKSGKEAIAGGARCLILDDGMQHRRLKRDVEIVVIDALDPFSQGRFLPWGLLRDSLQRLASADLIVATHLKDPLHYQQLRQELDRFTSALLVGACIDVANKGTFPPRKVGLFCGIGNPSHFLQTARDLNQEIVETLILRDHGSLKRGELERFAKCCLEKGAEVLLCTEKDEVKLKQGSSLSLDIISVPIALSITYGKEHWEHLIENILDRVVT